MHTHVFNRDREVCSKAADGKSSSAFPDVCWSPPGPPAGPVPLPYPNTAFASDLTNGTRTVFICGTMVAQKDKSYFSTSTGDEPATMAFQKGIVTGALQGKAYFASWSMDVKAEGFNVARHQDLMTHNHASPPGNTPPQIYFDHGGRARAACAKELERIQKACKPDNEEDADADNKTKGVRKMRRGLISKLKARFSKMSDAFKEAKEKAGSYKATKDNAWMDDHCAGLWIKPATNYADQMKEFTDSLEALRGDLAGVVADLVKPLVESLAGELLEKLAKEAAERGVKLGARAAARWGAGAAGAAVAGVGAAVTETLATAWNIYDWGSTAWDGYQLSKEVYASIDEITSIMGDFDKAINQLSDIVKNAAADPQRAMSDAMGIFARMNACTRARRCILVPFRNTKLPGSLGGNGCCPGQTGHHVLPDSITKGGNCPGYAHSAAPTVCVEGVSNNHGTHAQIHGKFKKYMEDYNNRFTLFGSKDTISYGAARDMGIKSLQRTFPESKCSEDCLRAQLDAYYKTKCTKALPAKAPPTADSGSESGNVWDR